MSENRKDHESWHYAPNFCRNDPNISRGGNSKVDPHTAYGAQRLRAQVPVTSSMTVTRLVLEQVGSSKGTWRE